MAKVLIVDDDPDIREAGQLVLEKAGHEVDTAASRLEGMTKLKTFNPDLLVLDVVMEQPDEGFAMAQEIRRMGLTLPILMLTSVATASGLAFGPDHEMVPVDAFVSKPVEPAALIKQVAELLNR